MANSTSPLQEQAESFAPNRASANRLAARLFTLIAGLAPTPLRMEAEGTLVQRPMAVYESLLMRMAANRAASTALCRNRRPSSVARRNWRRLSAPNTLPLFALPNLLHGSELKVTHPTSTPYLKMTLEVLEDFGISITADDAFTHFQIGGTPFTAIDTVVDGDWSGAAALAVAGMLCAEDPLRFTAYRTNTPKPMRPFEAPCSQAEPIGN